MAHAPISRAQTAIIPALLVVTLAVFWQSQSFGFFAVDDAQYVTGNARTLQGLSINNVVAAFTQVQASNYHPVTMISLMADTSLFGSHPGAYHRVNLVLHVINVLLLYGLLRAMTGAPWPSAAVAMLFAIHPLHVEPVVWISSRKDLLSTLFMLIACAFYVRFVRTRARRDYGLVTAAFVLALLSKQMPVTLPFVLLLFDYWPLNRFPDHKIDLRIARRLVFEKVPLFAVAFLFAVVVTIVQRSTGALQSADVVTLSERVINTPVAYAMYLLQTLVPVRLQAIGYGIPDTIAWWQSLGALVVLAAITAACIRYARRWPYLPVGWFFFLGTLVPVIGLVTLGSTYRADRYTYVPLIGLFIIAAWGAAGILAHERIQPRIQLVRFTLGIVLAAYAAMAWTQVALWGDNRSMLARVIELDREHYLAHLSLGDLYRSEGDRMKAAEHYLEILKFAPGSARVHVRLGQMQAEIGNPARAERFFDAAYDIDPADYAAIMGYARTKTALGKVDEADRALSAAIAAGHPESAALEAERARLREERP